MRFLMLVCADPSAEPYKKEGDAIEEWIAFCESKNARVLGDRTRPQDAAFSVGLRNGKTVVTEGPYADTHGRILGFDVIDCANKEEAVEIGRRHPMARFGRVEFRPVWPMEES